MRWILGLIALASAGPAVAQETAPTPVAAYVTAQACLQTRVGEAVRSSSGGADAADFLLTYLCAAEVDAASAYARNTAALAALRDTFRAMTAASIFHDLGAAEDSSTSTDGTNPDGVGETPDADMFSQTSVESVSVDPVSGEIVMSDAAPDAFANMALMQVSALKLTGEPAIPAILRSYAGQLIIQARR